jgi:hypothetical protein
MKKPDLQTQTWESLFDISDGQAKRNSKNSIAPKKNSSVGDLASKKPDESLELIQLPANERLLADDIVVFLASPFSERQSRLNFSARQIEDSKKGLLNRGLIKEVFLGKYLMLAPSAHLYSLLGMDSPFKRDRWGIHSFLVLLAARLIESNPLVKYTRIEVPLGDSSSSTIDVVGYFKNGDRCAYELVHRSVTNVASLAAKLIGKHYTTTTFLCTEYNVKERVRTLIRNSGFDMDFLSTLRYQIFSTLIRQKKQMMLKEMR